MHVSVRAASLAPYWFILLSDNSKIMPSNQSEPVIWCTKIRPSRISIYKERQKSCKSQQERPPWMENFANNSTGGILSKAASMKIKNGISWLMYLAKPRTMTNPVSGKNYKFRLSFFTLSLPSSQIHDDTEIKSGPLNQFLTEAKIKWGLKNYLWRAEPQKNGNIHFHIISDCFIPYLELRRVWNRCINKLGYVDAFSKKMHDKFKDGFYCDTGKPGSAKWNLAKERYTKGVAKNWSDPNSTDIKSVSKIKNLASYLAEYCAKKSEGREITGRLWYLSTSLSKLDGACFDIDDKISDEFKKIQKKYEDSLKYYDYCSVYYVNTYMLAQAGCYHILSLLKKYASKIINDSS